MSVDAGEKAIGLPEKFSIEDLMKQAATRAAGGDAAGPAGREDDAGDGPDGLPSLDQLSALPQPGDPYKAYSRASNRPLPTLFLVKADGTFWSYPYSCRVEGPHLVRADDAAGNLVVVLRFSGLAGIEVTLAGRRLEQLTNYLGHHRIAWVRELARGKLGVDEGGPVVTGITVRELER